MCQKENNFIVFFNNIFEWIAPSYYSDVSYSNVLLTHTVTRKTEIVFFIYIDFIFLQNLTKNYIHRNPACPQIKTLVGTNMCLFEKVPNQKKEEEDKSKKK